MKSDRVYLFDNLKFFLILATVMGHLASPYTSGDYVSDGFQSLFVFIYAFHMPLFILISGYFYSERRIGAKIFSFAMLCLATKYAYFGARAIVGLKNNIMLFGGDDISWYLGVQCIYLTVTFVTRKTNKWALLGISIFLSLVAGYDSTIQDFLFLSRAIVFYPFFLTGTMLRRTDFVNKKKSIPLKAVCGIAVAVWGIFCVKMLEEVYKFRQPFTGRNPYDKFKFETLTPWMWRLIAYAITFALCFSLLILAPKKKLPCISAWGERTLQVYFWHLAVLHLLFRSRAPFCAQINALVGSTPGRVFYIVVIGTALTILLSLKLFEFPTKQIRLLGMKAGVIMEKR